MTVVPEEDIWAAPSDGYVVRVVRFLTTSKPRTADACWHSASTLESSGVNVPVRMIAVSRQERSTSVHSFRPMTHSARPSLNAATASTCTLRSGISRAPRR